MTYQYDAGSGLIVTSLRIGHTVTPNVWKRVDFWLCCILHAAVLCGYHMGYVPHDCVDGGPLFISWDDIKIITAMTTFFEVFYTNESYRRYMFLYDSVNSLMAAGFEFCYQLRLFARAAGKPHILLPARWLNTTFILFFWQLQGNEVTIAEIDKLQSIGLLRQGERDFLATHSVEQLHLILLQWCAEVACVGTAEAKSPLNVNNNLVDKLVACHHLQLVLMDTMELPLPFQYFHLLSVMISVNLVLWAYSMGTTASIFAPVVYYLASFLFVGMMDLASQLSNPFGEDEVDFPIRDWLLEFFSDQQALLHHQFPYNISDVAKNWKDTLEADGRFTWDPTNFDGIESFTPDRVHEHSDQDNFSNPSAYFEREPLSGTEMCAPILGYSMSPSPSLSPSPRTDGETRFLLGSKSAASDQQKWIL